MKTAKVTIVHSTKEWKGEKGTVWFNNVTLDNKDEVNIGKKEPLKEGDEITYEITDLDGQQRFKKAKAVQPPKPFSSGNFAPKNEDMIVAQSTLGYACNFYAQRGQANEDMVIAFAKKMFDEVMKHKK